jgi:hypothetical protein
VCEGRSFCCGGRYRQAYFLVEGFLQVAVRWWILITGVVVRISVLSEGRVGKLNTGDRCKAIVLILL